MSVLLARLFIRNLSYSVDAPGLTKALADLGIAAENVRIALDKETKQSRGFAFVDTPADRIQEVIKILNAGIVIGNRQIAVAMADRQPSEDRPPHRSRREHTHPEPHEDTWREERRKQRRR